MLHQFGLRHGSAGLGKWHGGEGVVRELEVLESMQVSILSEVNVISAVLPDNSLIIIIFSDGQGSRTVWRVEAQGP